MGRCNVNCPLYIWDKKTTPDSSKWAPEDKVKNLRALNAPTTNQKKRARRKRKSK
jgi:hypothetical protein